MKTKNEKELMETKKEMIKMIGDMENTGILVTDNAMSVHGTGINLMTKITLLFRELQNKTGIKKETLQKALDISSMTNEELIEESKNTLKELLDKISKEKEE